MDESTTSILGNQLGLGDGSKTYKKENVTNQTTRSACQRSDVGEPDTGVI